MPVGLSEIATGEAAPPANESLLDQLRKKREEATANKEVYIPIPGYDREPPILVAKYRVLEGDELNRMGRKVQAETRDPWDRQILAAIDGMISACVGMFIDLQDGSEPQPMTKDGQPVAGFSPELAAGLGFQANNAREVVLGVFVGNEIAIMQHNVRLSLWMGNTSRKIEEDIFSGEF